VLDRHSELVYGVLTIRSSPSAEDSIRAVFISYRRSDAQGEAGRLCDDLVREFGEQSVFMDVAGIQPGRDFRKVIDDSVATCGVLLAIIGTDWVEAKNEAGNRRLDDPSDFVRLETASALKRDIPVVPVLVQGARMPQPEALPDDLKDLAYRNAVELTHARWNGDLQFLIKALRPLVDSEKKKSEVLTAEPVPEPIPAPTALPEPQPKPTPRWRLLKLALASLGLLVVSVIAYLIVSPRRVTVPDVRGSTLQDAATKLTSVGLAMGKTTTQLDPMKEPDTVIAQSPAPGARTDQGTKIDLALSPSLVQIPKLVGETRHFAEEALKDRQLMAEITQQQMQQKTNDTVLSTSPSSGEWVKPGTKVEVVVASSSEASQNVQATTPSSGTVQVPNLIGIPFSQARVQLQAMGLAVGISKRQQRQGAADTVLAQSPSAGQRVQPGSRVDITYAESSVHEVRPGQTGQRSIPSFAGTWEWYETWLNGRPGTIASTANRTTVISQNGDVVTINNRVLRITPAGTLTGQSFSKSNGYPVPEDQAQVIRTFTWRLEDSILVREDVIDYTERYSSHPPRQGKGLAKYRRISP
jgi:beta-lactam-binding protein with PASTA domain